MREIISVIPVSHCHGKKIWETIGKKLSKAYTEIEPFNPFIVRKTSSSIIFKYDKKSVYTFHNTVWALQHSNINHGTLGIILSHISSVCKWVCKKFVLVIKCRVYHMLIIRKWIIKHFRMQSKKKKIVKSW